MGKWDNATEEDVLSGNAGYCEVGEHYDDYKAIYGFVKVSEHNVNQFRETIATCEECEPLALEYLAREAIDECCEENPDASADNVRAFINSLPNDDYSAKDILGGFERVFADGGKGFIHTLTA